MVVFGKYVEYYEIKPCLHQQLGLISVQRWILSEFWVKATPMPSFSTILVACKLHRI